MFDRDDKRPWLWIILGGAFLVRSAAAVCVQGWVDRTPGRLCLIAGDAEGYWDLGKKLASGEEFAIYDPPRRVFRMPGFPLVLALGITVLGQNVLAVRFLLAAIGTGACGLVYVLACELFDRPTALRACLIAALFPPFVLFSVLLLSETLFAMMLLASLLAIAKLVLGNATERSASAQRAIAIVAGLLVGLATLVRPTWLLVGPVFAVLHLFLAPNRRRAAIEGALLLAALAVALAPWTIRNWNVTGHLVPTTLWAGPSLYDGLHDGATGASDMKFIETDGIYGRMSEYDADRHYRDEAVRFVRAHPGRTLALAAIKFARFWNPAPNSAQFGHWMIVVASLLSALPLWALAAYGGWNARGCLPRWLIPAGPALYFTLVHLVFIGAPRYRLPAEYPLVVLAAAGWSALAAKAHGGAP